MVFVLKMEIILTGHNSVTFVEFLDFHNNRSPILRFLYPQLVYSCI